MTDPRIKAIVVAAPAIGFTFDRTGLEGVRIPVQLWRADNDQILPAPSSAGTVRFALPNKPEFHAVPDAGHFDFLAPCAESATMPQLCASAPGFDRTKFHTRFNAQVVRFFVEKLGPPALAVMPDGRRLRPYTACYAIVGSSAEGSPVIGSTLQSVGMTAWKNGRSGGSYCISVSPTAGSICVMLSRSMRAPCARSR